MKTPRLRNLIKALMTRESKYRKIARRAMDGIALARKLHRRALQKRH